MTGGPRRGPSLSARGSRQQPSGGPGAVAADQVGGVPHPEVLQARRGQARRVALGADDDHAEVVGRRRQPGPTGRVEAPLQDVALDHQSSRDLASTARRAAGPDVDEHRVDARDGPRRLVRVQAVQPATGLEHLVDRAGPGDAGALTIRSLRSRSRPGRAAPRRAGSGASPPVRGSRRAGSRNEGPPRHIVGVIRAEAAHPTAGEDRSVTEVPPGSLGRTIRRTPDTTRRSGCVACPARRR